MSTKREATHTQPGGTLDHDDDADDGVINDSFGTIDTADSTGTDENKETGEAKTHNLNTRED